MRFTFLIAFSVMLSITFASEAESPRFATAAGPAEPPNGWFVLCKSKPNFLCFADPTDPQKPIPATPKWMKVAYEVNLMVNITVDPVTDFDHFKVNERWDYPSDDKGDCEDYALEKRRLLYRRGFPLSALRIAVVKDEEGLGHAVLLLHTTYADFVLDNKRKTDIVMWSETGYTFLKMQTAANPMRWVKVKQPTAMLTGSVDLQ